MHTLAILSFVVLQAVLPPAKKEPVSVAPPAPSERAVLQFDWPAGLDAKVDTERSREQQMGDKAKPPRSLKATYRMRVRPHDAGLIVRSEEFSGLTVNDIFANGVGLEDAIASLVPSTVVTRDGDFVRAEDTAAVKALLTKMFDAFLADKKELPPQFKQILERATSDEFFDGTAAGEWSSLVGSWLEFPLSGELVEETVEEPSPVLPDLMVLLKVSRRMVERSECTRGGVHYACGVFEMRSEVDPASMRDAFARLTEGVKDVPRITYEDVDMVTIARVRLETATMLPHALTITRTVKMTMSAPGYPATVVRQVERRNSTFSY